MRVAAARMGCMNARVMIVVILMMTRVRAFQPRSERIAQIVRM